MGGKKWMLKIIWLQPKKQPRYTFCFGFYAFLNCISHCYLEWNSFMDVFLYYGIVTGNVCYCPLRFDTIAVTWFSLTRRWWSQTKKARGEPLRLRVSIASNRNLPLPLVLLSWDTDRCSPKSTISGKIYITCSCFHTWCQRRRARGGCEETEALQRMIVRTEKARCPRRTHLKSWPSKMLL